MKKLLATLSTLALISMPPKALAASSTELTVTGTITPSACTPGLSGGGLVDLGKISAKDLRQDRWTEISKDPMQLTVACDAATLFALDAIDNRAGTTFDEGAFGMGLTDAGEKLGAYWVRIDTIQADGQPARAITSINGGVNWVFTDYIVEEFPTAVSTSGTPLPIPASNVSMDLEIRSLIARADSLTLTNEVTIDGSATIEVKYL